MSDLEVKPSLVAFDLDDTLAPSKSLVEEPMRIALLALLDEVEVCIISGGNYTQFESQILRHLPVGDHLTRLHVMPTCGTQYYRWAEGSWNQVYIRELTPQQKSTTISALEDVARSLGLWSTQTWGPIIEDRGSQITFSALGQGAPVDAKAAWDPGGSKREALRREVAPLVPELEVRAGGSTSIDVTLRGVDKAYGIRELCTATQLELDDLLFIGDRLDVGGNDYPVKALGVRCIAVANWHETLAVVTTLTETLKNNGKHLSSPAA